MAPTTIAPPTTYGMYLVLLDDTIEVDDDPHVGGFGKVIADNVLSMPYLPACSVLNIVSAV